MDSDSPPPDGVTIAELIASSDVGRCRLLPGPSLQFADRRATGPAQLRPPWFGMSVFRCRQSGVDRHEFGGIRKLRQGTVKRRAVDLSLQIGALSRDVIRVGLGHHHRLRGVTWGALRTVADPLNVQTMDPTRSRVLGILVVVPGCAATAGKLPFERFLSGECPRGRYNSDLVVRLHVATACRSSGGLLDTRKLSVTRSVAHPDRNGHILNPPGCAGTRPGGFGIRLQRRGRGCDDFVTRYRLRWLSLRPR
jgi:hypothetical protein